MVLRSLRILALFLVPLFAFASKWPFDQRQILLVHRAGTEFPDDLSVAQILDRFVQRGRVRWVTQRGGKNQVLPIEVPKDFPWYSTPSVQNLGQKYKVDGIVSLAKNGVLYELHWYSSSDGSPLFFEKMSLPFASSPQEEGERKQRIQAWVNDIWNRIPGLGYVLNRDTKHVYVEGLSSSQLKAGDVLKFLRLETVTRHPMLKTLTGVTNTETGLGTIVSIGEPLSKVSIDYESPLDPIQEGDRYAPKGETSTNVAPVKEAVVVKEAATTEASEKNESIGNLPSLKEEMEDQNTKPKFILPAGFEERFSNKPKLGLADATMRFFLGTVTYEDVFTNENYTSNGLHGGLALDSYLYLTKNLILVPNFVFGFGNYMGVSGKYGNTSLSSALMNYGLQLAYKLEIPEIPVTSPFVPAFYFMGGYNNFDFAISRSGSAKSPTSKSYSGAIFGFRIDVPVYLEYIAKLEASRLIFTRMSEGPVTSGATATHSYWQSDLGVIKKLNGVSSATIGMMFMRANSTFVGTGTRATPSLSSSISPNLFYGSYEYKF